MVRDAAIDGIRTVSLLSHSSGSVLGTTQFNELTQSLNHAAQDSKARAVLLQGTSGCFCQGSDLDGLLSVEKRPELLRSVLSFFKTLMSFPKPLVAAVDGNAVGVGTTMLLHCDITIATERSTFKAPFCDLGLVPEAGASALLPAMLGYQRAYEMFCLGGELSAHDAARLGFVTRTTNADDHETIVNRVLTTLSKKPVASLARTKALMRPNQEALITHMEREVQSFVDQLEHEDTIRRLRLIARRMRTSSPHRKAASA